MYAYNNNDKYPDDLLKLFPEHLDDNYEILICKQGQKALKKKLQEKETNYIYLSGLTSESPHDCIVVFDRKINHGDGRNVLYFDAHAMWYEEKKFKQELKRMLDDPTYKDHYSEEALDIMNGILKE